MAVRRGPLPPPDPLFKMTIDTTQPGSPADTFVLPLQSTTNNFVIDWGDGMSETVTSVTSISHTYASGGTYQISLEGSFDGIRFANTGDKLKLSSIDQWGTNQWVSCNGGFNGCLNMIGTYTDAPNTTGVQDFSQMFNQCQLFNGAVEFDTSSATNMLSMFANCYVFNQPVNFNTSNVTLMNSMFSGALIFNQPVNFDTSKVDDTSFMFIAARKFNQPINWNAPLLTNTTSMFYDAREFNSPVTLTTSSVLSNLSSTFRKATVFNSLVTISDTSGVRSMGRMFDEAFAFDQDISAFDPSSLDTIAIGGGGAWFMMASISWSTLNYDKLLIAWDAYGTSDCRFTAGLAQYSAGAAATARANMISRGWQIFDGGQV